MSADRCQRVALFGGSFDPVHRGHVHMAGQAVAACGLDRVIFLPCWQSPHKAGKRIAPAADRLAMLRLATAGIPWAEVSDWELERAEASFSWRTAEHFSAELGAGAELYWIAGADQWEVIESWARPQVLASLLHFIVFPRGGTPQQKQGFRMIAIDAPFEASSTEVRRRVRDGEGISALVEPAVEGYIRARGLYQSA